MANNSEVDMLLRNFIFVTLPEVKRIPTFQRYNRNVRINICDISPSYGKEGIWESL